jgi:hypothetical protein
MAHEPSRWNVERTDAGIRVCFGDHDKSAACVFVDMIPASEAAELTAAVVNEAAELTMVAATLRNAAYETLPPSRPSWGMGGGSAMEANAQDRWEAEHGCGKNYVRITRDKADALYRVLAELPSRVTDLGVAMLRRAKGIVE